MSDRIDFEKYSLANGLTVILHQDQSSPTVAISVVYKVGSRNEDPEMTGLAHLFEHLMFSGTSYIKDFDIPLQMAGGDGNAFTNADITCYYCSLPAENFETGLWLESERMRDLKLTDKKLLNQKKVVIEEFKETCLDEPYGDIWHIISKGCYEVYPYSWPVIGNSIEHIEKVNMTNAIAFYEKFYCPNNAILSISGRFDQQIAKDAIEKWFGTIPKKEDFVFLPKDEPSNKGYQLLKGEGNVTADAVYLCFLAPHRKSEDYYALDLFSDWLGNGKSSLLYQRFVKEQQICISMDAYMTASDGPGLLVIEGKLHQNASPEHLELELWNLLSEISNTKCDGYTLTKLKNKTLSTLAFSEISPSSIAINLASFEAMKDAEEMNKEEAAYLAVNAENIQDASIKYISKDNCTSIHYLKKTV